jgi:hypothetical protein
MSGDDRLVAAREHARNALLNGDVYELIFHRHRESREKMTLEEVLHDRHLLRPRFALPFSSRQRMPEAELEETYLAATRKNDLKAHCALINEAIAYLSNPGFKLPNKHIGDLIANYAAEALEKYRMLISKKRGLKAEKNFIRDKMIAYVIEGLQYQFELAPTRNREEKAHESGCSIVAGVLAEGGLPLTEQAVEKIWQRRELD